jgi:hypothetical protein
MSHFEGTVLKIIVCHTNPSGVSLLLCLPSYMRICYLDFNSTVCGTVFSCVLQKDVRRKHKHTMVTNKLFF